MSSNDQSGFEPPTGPPNDQNTVSQPAPYQPPAQATPGTEPAPLFPPPQSGVPPQAAPGQAYPQPGLQYGQPGQQQAYPQDPYAQQQQQQYAQPQQQYAQPGGYQAYPPAQAEPQKKSRKWLWILLAVPLLLLLGIGGCTALLISSVSGPIDATNAFVAELDNGDYAAAYNMLCTATKSSEDPDQWAADVAAGLGTDITDYSFTEASVQSSSGPDTATVSGSIAVDGVERFVTYGLVKEGDDWRVCTAS